MLILSLFCVMVAVPVSFRWRKEVRQRRQRVADQLARITSYHA
jgi:hypothetical protein